MKESLSLPENAKAKLTITFSGKPAPEIKWFRNGREIFDGRRQWIETSENQSSLVIGELREEDEGNILVVLENRAGRIESRCSLSTKGHYFFLH